MLAKSMPENQADTFSEYWEERLQEVKDPVVEGFVVRISSNDMIRDKYSGFLAPKSVIIFQQLQHHKVQF